MKAAGFILFLFAGLGLAPLQAKPKKGKSKPAPTPAPQLNRIDLARVAGDSLPAGVAVVRGEWRVDAASRTLRAAPEPLLDAWLEFGPETREKGAVIRATGRAPGRGRIHSRFGVGLYGKNGFQIRTAPARGEVELVRRGEVILRRSLPHDPATPLHLELSVNPEGRKWIVAGRAWKEGEGRPDKALFSHKVFPVELEFPLAGRAVLLATPFSGEAVEFSEAEVTPP